MLLIPLPAFNYYVDQYRVLSKDYINYYNNEPNKHYLKLHYLLNNKHNFTKFLFGSSRVQSIDTSMLGKEWYNMTYSFGIPAIHLYNLKLMIKNNLKIEEVIIGINDGAIWKDPTDFENDYLRKVYPDSFFSTIQFYKSYLYKKPTKRDFDILKGKNPIKKSENEILHPSDIKNVRLEKAKLKNPKKHIEYIEKTPILLGYNKKHYRIDQAVAEIREIKELCEKNNIKYTFVFMPVYKNVYEKYDQEKIKEFKSKLSEIIDFQDFYKINELTSTPIYWRDTSHLFPGPTNQYITPFLKKPENHPG